LSKVNTVKLRKWWSRITSQS